MSETRHQPLARGRNGVAEPLYFERQVVRATDLTLDRTSHAAELNRLRRFLHGWGVVAGFIPRIDDGTLQVGHGYGVTPLGREVWLTEPLLIPNIAELALACCGAGQPGCAIVDPVEDRPEPGADLVTWLIAWPARDETDLRAGIAEGCAHPANTLRPARACGVVELGLICTLPEVHRSAYSFHVLTPNGGQRPGGAPAEPSDAMLKMPEEVTAAEDFLVLGQVLVDEEQKPWLTSTDRRSLLPTSVLQDWLVRGHGPRLYFVNRNPQAGGEHEVHRLGCPARLPDEENRLYLGVFLSAAEAVEAASTHFRLVDGCAYCSPSAHQR